MSLKPAAPPLFPARLLALGLGLSFAAACGDTGLALEGSSSGRDGEPADAGAPSSGATEPPDGGAVDDAGASQPELDAGVASELDAGLASDAGSAAGPDAGAHELGDGSDALEMFITSYDDGRSCPADCDSHVVFSSAHNGTANAFRPGSADSPLATRRANLRAPCRVGEACAICFDQAASSCIVTTYRGSGPKRGRFDVTPAFLKEWCAREGLPAPLAEKCRSHMASARRLAQRVSCIERPTHPSCVDVMEAAVAAKRADTPRYERCKAVGQRAYNASVGDPALQREHDCAYFANRRHPTGGWLLLTPGACREGYFVGKSGLDCCSGDPVQAAIDPTECGPFYR